MSCFLQNWSSMGINYDFKAGGQLDLTNVGPVPLHHTRLRISLAKILVLFIIFDTKDWKVLKLKRSSIIRSTTLILTALTKIRLRVSRRCPKCSDWLFRMNKKHPALKKMISFSKKNEKNFEMALRFFKTKYPPSRYVFTKLYTSQWISITFIKKHSSIYLKLFLRRNKSR